MWKSNGQGRRLRYLSAHPASKVRDGFKQVRQGDMTWWEEIPTSNRTVHPDYALDLMLADGNIYETINLEEYYNANITDIFRNKYLSPRSPYTTLQIPVQGIGEWCHPKDTAHIDDSGLRAATDADGVLKTSLGIPYKVSAAGNNVVYTSLFDDYPDSITIPLQGKARGMEC